MEVFVAVLGASRYTYVEACSSKRKEDFLRCVENALHDMGGVPEALVPDNLKSAVTKADRYEPMVNETFLGFAEHYETVVYPARVRKPKDKSLVENAVGIAYERIFAPLGRRTFFSLESLNKAIYSKLDELNGVTPSRRTRSRKELLEEIEKPMLSLIDWFTPHTGSR